MQPNTKNGLTTIVAMSLLGTSFFGCETPQPTNQTIDRDKQAIVQKILQRGVSYSERQAHEIQDILSEGWTIDDSSVQRVLASMQSHGEYQNFGSHTYFKQKAEQYLPLASLDSIITEHATEDSLAFSQPEEQVNKLLEESQINAKNQMYDAYHFVVTYLTNMKDTMVDPVEIDGEHNTIWEDKNPQLHIQAIDTKGDNSFEFLVDGIDGELTYFHGPAPLAIHKDALAAPILDYLATHLPEGKQKGIYSSEKAEQQEATPEMKIMQEKIKGYITTHPSDKPYVVTSGEKATAVEIPAIAMDEAVPNGPYQPTDSAQIEVIEYRPADNDTLPQKGGFPSSLEEDGTIHWYKETPKLTYWARDEKQNLRIQLTDYHVDGTIDKFVAPQGEIPYKDEIAQHVVDQIASFYIERHNMSLRR